MSDESPESPESGLVTTGLAGVVGSFDEPEPPPQAVNRLSIKPSARSFGNCKTTATTSEN